jgi:hypothetical protein
VWKSPRGYHDIDRGYHDIDRGYHDIDRGYHDIDSIYRDGQLYWWRKLECPKKTTDLPQVILISYNVVSSTPHQGAGYELATLAAIEIESISSRKSNLRYDHDRDGPHQYW